MLRLSGLVERLLLPASKITFLKIILINASAEWPGFRRASLF